MKTASILPAALLALAACDQTAPPPSPEPPAASQENSSLELKVNPDEGSFEFRKEEGGDNVDVGAERE